MNNLTLFEGVGVMIGLPITSLYDIYDIEGNKIFSFGEHTEVDTIVITSNDMFFRFDDVQVTADSFTPTLLWNLSNNLGQHLIDNFKNY